LAIRAEQGLHPNHRLINYHHFFIENIREGNEVLDIGCGNGALTFDISKKAKFVLGIDLDKANIEIAKRKYNAYNIEYKVGDTTEDLVGQKFDVVILSNVLEHIKDRISFLKNSKNSPQNFNQGADMLNRDWITLYKKELGLEWQLDPTHFTEYTLESFKAELKKAGLKLNKYSIQFGEIWAVVE
jgi:SAM-dependent methyltransferase